MESTNPLRIVAFLQNPYFKAESIPRIERAYERRSTPEGRAELNARYLFAGCLSGKRIKSAFGELCGDIVWEEASPKVGNKSSACFPPDPIHIFKTLEHFQPDVVITFGNQASKGIALVMEFNREWVLYHPFDLISCPHPAARSSDTIQRLKDASKSIRDKIALHP